MAALAFVSALRDREGREMAHKALDELLDQLEGAAPGKGTLRALSEQLMVSRLDLLAVCLETAIKRRYAKELAQKEAACPGCARGLRSWRTDPKELSTLHGRIVIHRPYFYCRSCRSGFCPLDEELELVSGVHQLDIQERSVLLGAELPFGLSEQQFDRLTGVKLSGHFIHGALNAVGEAATLEHVLPTAEEIARKIDDLRGGSRRRPVLVVACDGAMAPVRPEGGRRQKRGPGAWQEAKGVRMYLLGRAHRIVHLLSWHQICDKESLAVDLEVMATRIPRDAVRIALVADGADWIWDLMKRQFPEGEEILDYYHCAEHVHEVARLQYGEDSLDALEWSEGVLVNLCLNEVGRVVGGLRRLHPSTPLAAEKIRTLITYLENHATHFGYDELRRRGLPLGSGGIESANKLICHVRLKRSGAWWIKAKGNAMLRIRCAIYNGTFSKVFDAHSHQGSRAHHRD